MQQDQLNISSGPDDARPAAHSERDGARQTSDSVDTGQEGVAVDAAKADPLAQVRRARRFVIIGQTHDGRTFRPSDWAERLAGVMAGFRPARGGGQRAQGQAHLSYSPYVLPSRHGGFKCVIVDARLREIEPLAHHFVLNFALDNGLKTEVLD